MKQRLIDAELAEQLIWDRSQEMSDKEPMLSGAFAAAIGFLDKCPTIEAMPVVHGKWIFSKNNCGETECICPICESEAPSEFGRYTYIKSEFCHCCGAKLDIA